MGWSLEKEKALLVFELRLEGYGLLWRACLLPLCPIFCTLSQFSARFEKFFGACTALAFTKSKKLLNNESQKMRNTFWCRKGILCRLEWDGRARCSSPHRNGLSFIFIWIYFESGSFAVAHARARVSQAHIRTRAISDSFLCCLACILHLSWHFALCIWPALCILHWHFCRPLCFSLFRAKETYTAF